MLARMRRAVAIDAQPVDGSRASLAAVGAATAETADFGFEFAAFFLLRLWS